MSPQKRIAVLSQGCAANFGDGEKLARALAAQNPDCEITFDFPTEEPVAFYLNVCTVKGNVGALKLLRSAYEQFPKVPLFVTGCAPKDFQEEAKKITDKVTFTSLDKVSIGRPIESSLRQSPYIGIVNIEEGCLDACAFCSTRLVKGRLRSFAPESIVQQVKNFVDDGCKEIQLTGQDCACYGFDIGTNLAELTQRILTQVPGDYKLRLGMGNPRHLRLYKDSLLECFHDDRVYRFLHLPVQSGSPSVLQGMNRKHTVEDYCDFALELLEKFPLFTLSTDLIVGFPGETETDFQQTLDLLKLTRPSVCNITRFVARPGTPAARLEQANAPDCPAVPDSVKHLRSALLFDTFQKIAQENNQLWLGRECRVVCEKQGHRSGTTIARNSAYKPVALQGDFAPGQVLQVRITGAEPFALIADIS
jgi:MiaB/RimO family radical SAM methylthiotransferase